MRLIFHSVANVPASVLDTPAFAVGVGEGFRAASCVSTPRMVHRMTFGRLLCSFERLFS
jgi:hypothetical protein